MRALGCVFRLLSGLLSGTCLVGHSFSMRALDSLLWYVIDNAPYDTFACVFLPPALFLPALSYVQHTVIQMYQSLSAQLAAMVDRQQ